jgi:hypothetical protein
MSAALLLLVPVVVALAAVFHGSDSRQLGGRRPNW